MRGFGIHTLEPAEALGPLPLAGLNIDSEKVGTLTFWAVAVLVPAAGGACAGAALSSTHRARGAAIGGLGGAMGGIAAVLILKGMSS